MKKLLIILLILLIPTLCNAGGVMMMGGGVPSACDSCTGTLLFSWHMENVDVALGTPCGCSLGDTVATLNSGANISTTHYEGTYGLNCPTSSDNATFTITTEDIFNVEKGTIIFYFKVNTVFTANNPIVKISMDVRNYLLLALNGTEEVRLDFYGDGVGVAWITVNSNLVVDTWYKLTFKYTTDNVDPNTSIQIDNNTAETNNTNLTVMTTTSGSLIVGDPAAAGFNEDYDYIKIYNDWL